MGSIRGEVNKKELTKSFEIWVDGQLMNPIQEQDIYFSCMGSYLAITLADLNEELVIFTSANYNSYWILSTELKTEMIIEYIGNLKLIFV